MNVIKACLNHSIVVEMFSNGHLMLELYLSNRTGKSHVLLWVSNKRVASSVINSLGALGTFTVLRGAKDVVYNRKAESKRSIAMLKFSIP